MPAATLTAKGQLTLPKEIRERLSVGPGDRVLFREEADGRIVVEAATVDFRGLFGKLKPKRKGISLDDMEAAIRKGAIRR